MLEIVVGQRGVTRSKRGTFETREIFVGRSDACELHLGDGTVSGVHCRLVAIAGATVVMDEGSTNGTWLNGVRITHPVVVTFGDELRVGPYVLRIQSLAGGSARVSAAQRERPSSTTSPTDSYAVVGPRYWEVLSIGVSSSLQDARAAYHRLIAQYHPDKVAHLGDELRELAARKCREINAAWEQANQACR
ncbi:FHA domain-containing protein [Corallococcus exiguus]|uniref:FHA domain-containing protein n=1 Tax=Corallococcus exiguus TaxID=83462 RepID=UPI00345AD57C